MKRFANLFATLALVMSAAAPTAVMAGRSGQIKVKATVATRATLLPNFTVAKPAGALDRAAEAPANQRTMHVLGVTDAADDSGEATYEVFRVRKDGVTWDAARDGRLTPGRVRHALRGARVPVIGDAAAIDLGTTRQLEVAEPIAAGEVFMLESTGVSAGTRVVLAEGHTALRAQAATASRGDVAQVTIAATAEPYLNTDVINADVHLEDRGLGAPAHQHLTLRGGINAIPPGARYKILYKGEFATPKVVGDGVAHETTGSFRIKVKHNWASLYDGEGLENFRIRVETPGGAKEFGLAPGDGKAVKDVKGRATKWYVGRLGKPSYERGLASDERDAVVEGLEEAKAELFRQMEAFQDELAAPSSPRLYPGITPRELLRSTQIYKRTAMSTLFELRFLTAVYARMLTFRERYDDEQGPGRLEQVKLVFEDRSVKFWLTVARNGERIVKWDMYDHQGFVPAP